MSRFCAQSSRASYSVRIRCVVVCGRVSLAGTESGHRIFLWRKHGGSGRCSSYSTRMLIASALDVCCAWRMRFTAIRGQPIENPVVRVPSKCSHSCRPSVRLCRPSSSRSTLPLTVAAGGGDFVQNLQAFTPVLRSSGRISSVTTIPRYSTVLRVRAR